MKMAIRQWSRRRNTNQLLYYNGKWGHRYPLVYNRIYWS